MGEAFAGKKLGKKAMLGGRWRTVCLILIL